jgi:uncharacterized delta-60 repeat protein
MAIQSDGKIVLFGESRVAGDPVFTIIRLNTIGKPDPSWGQDGILLDDVGFYENVIYAADIQTDGKMLGSGWTIDSDGSFHWITARYNTNGTRDLDFGTDGVQETNIGNENEYAQKLVVAPDHSFYIVGSILVSSDFNWFLAKFLPGEYVKVHAPMPATGLEATVLPNIASSGQSLELRYTLKEMVPISAQLVDVNGKQLKSLLYNARESAGLHSSTIKLPEALLDGQYWIVLKAGSQQTSLPVLLKR